MFICVKNISRDKARKMLLENDLFLSKLTLMFDKSRTKGHVSLCMKRYDGRNRPDPKPRKYGKKNSKQQYVSSEVF
jgi:hypothetical protein